MGLRLRGGMHAHWSVATKVVPHNCARRQRMLAARAAMWQSRPAPAGSAGRSIIVSQQCLQAVNALVVKKCSCACAVLGLVVPRVSPHRAACSWVPLSCSLRNLQQWSSSRPPGDPTSPSLSLSAENDLVLHHLSSGSVTISVMGESTFALGQLQQVYIEQVTVFLGVLAGRLSSG